MQLKKIVRDSEIMREDDHSWPPPDKVGRQELEVVLDGEVCPCHSPSFDSLQSERNPARGQTYREQ
jgi:hypothetical protein